MVVVVDTCSLHRLVEYYLPLDKCGKLIPLLEQLFLSREIVMTQAVYQECQYTQKGKVLKALPFLSAQGRRLILQPNSFTPDKKLLRMVSENFTVKAKFDSLQPEQQEAQRETYLRGGDFSILQCAYMFKKGLADSLFGDDLQVLTDESPTDNDNKCFKKIPVCCKVLGTPTVNIRQYLEIVTDGKIELMLKP